MRFTSAVCRKHNSFRHLHTVQRRKYLRIHLWGPSDPMKRDKSSNYEWMYYRSSESLQFFRLTMSSTPPKLGVELTVPSNPMKFEKDDEKMRVKVRSREEGCNAQVRKSIWETIQLCDKISKIKYKQHTVLWSTFDINPKAIGYSHTRNYATFIYCVYE